MQTAGILLFSYIHSKYWFIDAIYLTFDDVVNTGIATEIDTFILLHDYRPLMDMFLKADMEHILNSSLEDDNTLYLLLNLVKDGKIAFLDMSTVKECMKRVVMYFNKGFMNGLLFLINS